MLTYKCKHCNIVVTCYIAHILFQSQTTVDVTIESTAVKDDLVISGYDVQVVIIKSMIPYQQTYVHCILFTKNIILSVILLTRSYNTLLNKADVTSEGLPIKGVRFFLYQISSKVCLVIKFQFLNMPVIWEDSS